MEICLFLEVGEFLYEEALMLETFYFKKKWQILFLKKIEPKWNKPVIMNEQ